MTVLHINHTSYRQLLPDIAAQFNLPFTTGSDILQFTPPAGQGILKAISLFDELEVLLADFKLFDGLITIREQANSRYFILHFDDVLINDTALVKVDDETLQKTNTRHAVARLTSNLFQNSEELPPHLHIKSVKVLFNEAWLKKYMGLNAASDVVQQYLSLKTESFDIEPLDAAYLKLMNELWEADKNDPLQNMYLQNRVTLLIERFFTRLYSKSNLLQGHFDLSSDVINRLIKVEKTLVQDFSKMPPTIDQFSKIISMSSTVLKRSFKAMYGNSIYSYYQHKRLQKANELLISGQYNVKQAAAAVGYSSVANFTAAFKKQYKKLPATVLTAQ